MTRFALVLTTALLLAGCGAAPTAPTAASARAGQQVAAKDWDRMEISYSYKLGAKAAKQFVADAEALAKDFKASKGTCKLTAKAGLFSTTVQVELAGPMAPVMALRDQLDALHKKLK